MPFKCNICNWEGTHYLKRDNSLVCPRCNSRQRHRSIYRYLEEHRLLVGNACLDVASRRIFQRKLRYSNYVNIDIIPGRAEILMDVCDLKFSENKFDLIICCSVLQFVLAYETALDELHRVLKPTGKCIIQVPYDCSSDHTIKQVSDAGLNKYRYRPEHEIVFFSYKDFLHCLQQRFLVETFFYQEPYISFSNQEFFVCSKIGLAM